MKKYSVGSLFAGVGGICLGFKNAKTEKSSYELIWANEFDKYAAETYRTNFSHNLLVGDIKYVLHPEMVENEIERSYFEKLHEQILEKPLDILNGGFPCQAFSIAGSQKGFDDERGNLFLNIIDLIEQLGEKFYKPRVLFLENVKNLKSHDHGNTYKIIKQKLEDCGYTIFEKIINTMDYTDIPQNRERIYIIGLLNDKDVKKFKVFDNIEKYNRKKAKKEKEELIKSIIDYKLSKDSNEKYFYTKNKYPNYFMTDDEFEKSGKGVKINLDEQITEKYQFYQCRRGMYVRKNKSDVCPTLTANMGTGGHNVPLIKCKDGIRKLTPAETFKLQGFPVGKGYKLPEKFNGKPYPDSQLYKQAGNAVSVPVIEMLATEILNLFDDVESEENK